MNTANLVRVSLLLAAGAVPACAVLPENTLQMPEVTLNDVEVVGFGFDSQTFLLSFGVHNPNPIRLPVRHLAYGVKLNGQRFASGETDCDVVIPANGDTTFAINVDLNLLQSAPQLLYIVRDGTRQEIRYEVEGQMGIDLPLVPTVRYRNNGQIRLAGD